MQETDTTRIGSAAVIVPTFVRLSARQRKENNVLAAIALFAWIVFRTTTAAAHSPAGYPQRA
jgi:hypothetical protein